MSKKLVDKIKLKIKKVNKINEEINKSYALLKASSFLLVTNCTEET